MQQQQHQAKTLVIHWHNTLVYYEKLDSNPLSPLLQRSNYTNK